MASSRSSGKAKQITHKYERRQATAEIRRELG